MTSFSFNRFKNVAVWDLTINRSFYTKTAVFVASIISLPVLMKYISVLWVRVSMIGHEAEDFNLPSDLNIDGTVGYIVYVIPIIMTVFMAYTFHNLLTRQGRINELTLPASNLERFLWHVLLVFVGGALVILVSVMIADLLHVFLGWSVAGQHNFNSITSAVFTLMTFPFRLIEDTTSYAWICLIICFVLYNIIHLSIFVLGNAYVYRQNLLKTILWLIAIMFTTIVLLGFVVSFIVGHNIEVDSIQNLLKHFSTNGAATLVLLVTMAVATVLWWLIYRLYKRAQITTRRNP